jgi:carbon-monoxide dehydrogenase medium subunit
VILPRFDVLVPATLTEASEMLREHAEKSVRILAGGTDLLVDLRKAIIPQHVPRCEGCSSHPKGMVRSTIDCSLWDSEPLADAGGSLRKALSNLQKGSPDYLLSLHKINELKGICKLDDGGWRIGALTTIKEIERSPQLRSSLTALAEGADNLGSPLVRNRGTIGGNIANARPAADLAVPTIGLGGTLVIKGLEKARSIFAKDFPKGPGITDLCPGEILTFITFPPTLPFSGSAYYKLANRKALEISTVGVSVWLSMAEPGGPILDARVSLGAVGPTPILAESARNCLLGKTPSDALYREAAKAASNDARPIDDHRGSAWYRLMMVEKLTERLLNVAFKRAMENK